jgi:hypothetical protein
MSTLEWVALVSIAVAVAATLRHGLLGFAVGAVGVWAWGGVTIELLYRFGHERESHMTDAVWMGGGGALIAAACCLPFLVGRFIVLMIRRNRDATSNA